MPFYNSRNLLNAQPLTYYAVAAIAITASNYTSDANASTLASSHNASVVEGYSQCTDSTSSNWVISLHEGWDTNLIGYKQTADDYVTTPVGGLFIFGEGPEGGYKVNAVYQAAYRTSSDEVTFDYLDVVSLEEGHLPLKLVRWWSNTGVLMIEDGYSPPRALNCEYHQNTTIVEGLIIQFEERIGLTGMEEVAGDRRVEMTQPQVVFQTNEKVHVGDEEISSWSPLYGQCVTVNLPEVAQEDRVAFYYRPYGVENATVSFMGMMQEMPTQRLRNGKKRPNYWGDQARINFTAPHATGNAEIKVCANNVSETSNKLDYDDFMIMEIVVEQRSLTSSIPPAPAMTERPLPSSNSPNETMKLITQTKWTLTSSTQSCGTGDTDTEYQRFLTTEYYNVIGGREYHANDGKVNYFYVDESARKFEAQYSTYTELTRSPWNFSTYSGQLQDDGSLRLIHEFQQIETATMNAPNPNYSLDRKEHILWPCDGLPGQTVTADDAERVFISVNEGQTFQSMPSCDVLFETSFESSDSQFVQTLQKVGGIWQGKMSHSAKCEATMPALCASFNGPWVNTPSQISDDPLVLRVEDDKCQSGYEFVFDGTVARVDVTHDSTCSLEPYSFYVMECRPN